jgi:hypothetical protein
MCSPWSWFGNLEDSEYPKSNNKGDFGGLEEQCQKGVTNSSNRKGVLEIVEVCNTRVPLLLCLSINSLSSWLGNMLILAKKPETKGEKPETKGEKKKKTATKKSLKSIFEQRQDAAIKISKDGSPLHRDPSKKHIFLAKYIAIHFEIDMVVRVCTGIK